MLVGVGAIAFVKVAIMRETVKTKRSDIRLRRRWCDAAAYSGMTWLRTQQDTLQKVASDPPLLARCVDDMERLEGARKQVMIN